MAGKRVVRITFIILTALQTVLAVMWLCNNATKIPDYALSLKYIEASADLVYDDFMSLYYTAFLWGLRFLFSNMTSWAVTIYIIQLAAVVIASIFLAGGLGLEGFIRYVAALFVVTNPIVLASCFSILPYAFRFVFVAFLIAHFINSCRRKRVMILAVVISLMLISNGLSTKGAYGSAEKSMLNLEMQRFVWPHIGEINYTFVLEQTGFDTSTVSESYLSVEHLWEDFLPRIDATYNAHDSKEIRQRYVSEYGFVTRKKETVLEWAKDIASYIFTPITLIANARGYGFTRFYTVYSRFVEYGASSIIYWHFSSLASVSMIVLSIFVSVIFKFRILTRRRVMTFVKVTVIFGLYFSFFALRGFDPMNVLWTVVMWPLVFSRKLIA